MNKISFQKRIGAIITVALLSCLVSFPALAKRGSLVDISIVDDRGRTLQEYNERRGATFVAGEPNQRYSVRLRNNTNERVLAVVSIDGVNVVSGETAGSWQQGYILAPYQRLDVDGWRKSMRDVARFYFTSVPDSYAGRTGRPQNVGVIGLAVFRERPQRVVIEQPKMRPYGSEEYGDHQAEPAMAPQASRGVTAERQASSPSLGTGHGERQSSYAYRATFERLTSHPNQVSAIRYNSYENLARMGIVPSRYYPTYDGRPQPFPNEFVPDPYY